MPIGTIEIMCIPCAKCERVKRLIIDAIKVIEFQNKVKIVHQFKHTPNLIQAAQYSVNASQAPIVIINGNVAFAGQVTNDVIIKKLEAIHKY
jgi:hypothetical protein